MKAYDDPAELAQICAKNSHATTSKEVARELWRMACEYRQKAADRDRGRLPDIGGPPPKIIGQEEPHWRPV